MNSNNSTNIEDFVKVCNWRPHLQDGEGVGVSAVNGFAMAVIAGVLWGLNPLFIKRYGEGFSPLSVNAVRGLYASIVMLPIALYFARDQPLGTLGLFFITLSAIFGPGIGDFFYVKSIRAVGAGNAIMLGYLYVFVSQVLATIFLHEDVKILSIIGGLVALTGVFTTYWPMREKHVESSAWGVAYGILAAVFWGISAIFSKIATGHGDPYVLTLLRNILLFTALVPFTLLELKNTTLSKKGALLGLTAGGLGFGVGMALFISALSTSGVLVATTPTMIAPLVARLLSMVLAGEKFTNVELIGTILVVIGIGLSGIDTRS